MRKRKRQIQSWGEGEADKVGQTERGRKSLANYEITTRMGIQIQILHQQQQQLCERNRLDAGDTNTHADTHLCTHRHTYTHTLKRSRLEGKPKKKKKTRQKLLKAVANYKAALSLFPLSVAFSLSLASPAAFSFYFICNFLCVRLDM